LTKNNGEKLASKPIFQRRLAGKSIRISLRIGAIPLIFAKGRLEFQIFLPRPAGDRPVSF
jgi:hypothetical protein